MCDVFKDSGASLFISDVLAYKKLAMSHCYH